jgi:predicted PurR-regulated permease PerM
MATNDASSRAPVLEPASPAPGSDPARRPLLHTLADVSWRALAVAAASLAVVLLLVELRLVVLPVIVALLLATLLVPPARWLERCGVPRLLAVGTVFVGFLGGMAAFGVLIVPAVADEFSGLGQTISEGVDDVQRWLVEGPAGLEPEQIERRKQAGQQLSDLARASSGTIASGALVLVEGLAGLILALVVCFFFVKDGRLMQRWALPRLPGRHHDTVRAAAARAWTALGAFLRGAALIGVVEALAIGLSLFLVGAKLVVPVMVITLLAAFFPIVGAVVAGVIAVLVALVTGGPGDALVVGIVALVVQQFDNDLLAPLIYGRMIKLHPVVVLLALTAGGSLAGIAGAFLAVPVAAVAVAVGNELRVRSEAGEN